MMGAAVGSVADTGGKRPGARKVGLKTGCSWAFVAVLMRPLLRLFGR